MRHSGLETVVIEGERGKTNVFGLSRAAASAARTILLSGHMDVVGPGDLASWRFEPFSATVAEGSIWGRGTVDMKGAIAAALFAIRAVTEQAGPLPANILLGATVDDETAGNMGQKYVLERGLESARLPKPDLHVLGEANGLNITTAFKGRVWVRAAIRGKTAHGGAPQEGVNAIEKMMEYFRRLQQQPRDRHPLLGEDTLNIGTVKGGARVNAVADECEATLDYRFSRVSGEEAGDRLRCVLEDWQREDGFSVSEFSIFEQRDPMEVDAGAVWHVNSLRRAILLATGREPDLLGALSAGDAYHSLKRSVPAVWVGPGDIRQLHAPNEHIPIEELILAARVYASILLVWSGIDPGS
jgi:acetylornithine deacetylase/succinyl-diaminopimelate desuccinylase-like protein